MLPFHAVLSSSFLLIVFFALLLMLLSAVAWAKAIPVQVRPSEQGWQLLRAGKPYFIRGAGGPPHWSC
jgi:hypothetical protein